MTDTPQTARSPRTVTEFLDGLPIGRVQIGLVVLCALVVLLDGADTIAIGLVGPGMAHTVGAPVASLGPVFSGGQFGFMAGSLIFGPLADRWGRKPVLLGAVALFGVATVLTATAHTVGLLLAYRFVTGVGLGGAAPVALALVAEYLPSRARATVVALSWAAFPFGGVAIGLVSVPILPHGWQWLFVLMGGAALVVGMLGLFGLPESLGFLLASGGRERQAREILARIGRGADGPLPAPPARERGRRVPARQLFTGGQAPRTLLLWVAFFASFLPLIFVTNWSPTILRGHGISPALIGLAITLNSLGSAIGSGAIGRAMDRLGNYGVILVALGLAALSLVGLGLAVGGSGGVLLAITASGVFAGAGQSGVITLGSIQYPTLIRSTAVGWAMAMGRLGAAVGPLLGGFMLAAAWSPVQVYGAAAVFPAVALVALLLVRQLAGRR